MTNDEFWSSIQRIINGGFTEDGLNKLEEYAEWFISDRLVYKRFSQAEQYGCSVGGAINVIASLLAGAEVGPDRASAPEGSFKREQQCSEEQARRIERWARAAGCWFENTDDSIPQILGAEIARGGEAQVYDNGTSLIKVIGLDYFLQPVLALDRISLHNAYFPQTKMTVLGFGRSADGLFKVVVEQPFIQGVPMSDKEIEAYANSLGYKLVDLASWTYSTPEVYLSDLHDENVIRSVRGNVFVIDCDIRINVPELHAGGNRRLTNEVMLKA